MKKLAGHILCSQDSMPYIKSVSVLLTHIALQNQLCMHPP